MEFGNAEREDVPGPAGVAPMVTVITPVYNAERTLERVVQSVAAQSGVSLEHILIDDGSADGSLSVLNVLSERFPHIKILQQSNQGAAAARNKGIHAARGKYIAFLDADDEWLPGKLAEQIRFMESDKCLFSYGDYKVFDAVEGKEVRHYELVDRLTYGDLLKGCPIGCLTVAYNSAVLGKVYMPNVRRGQDWALWLKITREGVVAKKYSGNLAVYNIGNSSLSSNKFKKFMDVYKVYRVEEKLGFASSLKNLFLHALYVLRKSYG